MSEEERPQKPPVPWAKPPAHILDYATPSAKPPMTVARALKIVLMVFLILIGVFLLAAGLCLGLVWLSMSTTNHG